MIVYTNIFGLILDLIGFIIIFYYGYFSKGQETLLQELFNFVFKNYIPTEKESDIDINELETIQKESGILEAKSHIGIVFIIFGIFLQLVSNIAQIL